MAPPHPPLYGISDDLDNTAGVLGEGRTGVYGRDITAATDTTHAGNGVIGYSENGRGVWGHSKHNAIGVLGEGTAGVGVMGNSQINIGVDGDSKTSYGVRGRSNSFAGVIGMSDLSRGVEGWANASEGVVGISKTGNGVWGQTDGAGAGVLATSKRGIGIHGKGGKLAGFFEGDVEVTGDIRLTNADCAEDFDITGAELAEPGTVMVLGEEGGLLQSHRPYDKRVAGVISGAGDYKPGIVLDKRRSEYNRQPVALLGKVFCKVDAQFGAIEVGDLLTTSATPGHAMKTSDPLKAFGAVIGKALRPLPEGQGLIPILIALQ